MLSLKSGILLTLQFIFTITCFSQYKINTYLKEAQAVISDKNYFDAIQLLGACIQVYPGACEAFYYRGICKYYLNDNLGAEQDLNDAISIYSPVVYDAFHFRSLVKYRLGDYDGAINDINQVINLQNNQPVLLFQRAFFKLSNQDYNGAIADCNAALNMNFSNENLYLCKGMAENALSKYDTALMDYNKALKINPRDEEIYVRIGITKANLGKYNEAIEEYNEALKLDSGSTLAYFNRAQAFLSIKNDKNAMRDFNMVIMYDPMNSFAYFDRSILEANKSDYKDAIADLDKVVALNPKNIQAYYNRAKLKTITNDYQGAINDYSKTIELFPYFVEAYYDRAHLKEILHDNLGAQVDFNLGKTMAEVAHSTNFFQRENDSTTLSHLSALNGNFNNDDKKLSDTTIIDLMPIFRLALRDNNYGNQGYSPLILKGNQQEYNNFCITDKRAKIQRIFNDSALNVLNERINDTTGQPYIILQKAIQETNMQLFNAAIKDYDKIIESDTGFAIAYFAKGVDLCKELDMLSRFNGGEQYTLVNKTYRVVTDPNNEKYEKALADFTKMVQLEPEFPYAYYDRAWVKYKLKDLNGAIDDYTMAIKLEPDLANAYYNRGLLLFLLNDKLNACENFSKAGELGLNEAYLLIERYCSQNLKQ